MKRRVDFFLVFSGAGFGAAAPTFGEGRGAGEAKTLDSKKFR